MYQRFVDIINGKTADVRFIFEGIDDNVEIAAHKDILAASSPIFNNIFNSELRSDVLVVDASPEAFKEFLQCSSMKRRLN